MDIYIADLAKFTDEQTVMDMCSFLPEERRERILRYRNAADKRRSMAAGLLLEYGLREKGCTLLAGIPDKRQMHIAYGEYGKPYLAEASDLYFNLSHTGSYAAAVFAKTETGIDIECVRTANLKLAKRFFSPEEYAYLRAACDSYAKNEYLDRAFVRLWTRKESYIKAVGEGMHLPLAHFNVLSDKIDGDIPYYLKSWELTGDCQIAVCAACAIKERVVWVDLAKAFDGNL